MTITGCHNKRKRRLLGTEYKDDEIKIYSSFLSGKIWWKGILVYEKDYGTEYTTPTTNRVNRTIRGRLMDIYVDAKQHQREKWDAKKREERFQPLPEKY